MDEIKEIERKIITIGSLVFFILVVIDALMYYKVDTIRNEVRTIKAEKVQQAWADSMATVTLQVALRHQASMDSLFLDLRQRLGVDWPIEPEPPAKE